VTYYRQTTRHVKSIDSGLLTGAAPYVFSTDRYLGGTLPAMISTLSSVETLDFIVPQSSIAIWPYPINRTKDHLRLATGSLLDSPSRMALGHIETFPRYFVEGERVLPSSVVVGQLLSTSMTRGASGVTTFIFSYLLDRKDGALADFRKAMDWFRSTERLRRSKSQVAAFFPQDPTYWPTVGTKVLASLRQAGLDIDPVQMPQGGSSSWLKLATSRHRVLILFDPPELKPFEARALAAMCKSGSSLIVLGYPPSGLREVLGVESRNIGKYGGFKLVERVGPRTPEGEVMKLGYEFVFCPTLRGAEPLAVLESIPHGFQPGAFAITRHRFGRGTSYFVAIPSLVALDRARDLLLDLVEAAMSGKGSAIPWEVDGLTQECDLLAGEDFLAVVNLGQEEISALARYTGSIESNRIVVSGAGSEVKTDGGVVRVNLKLKPMSPVLVTLFE